MSLLRPTQAYAFQRPAILGASRMGALIAARFADAGLQVRLYDKPVASEPNALAQEAIAALLYLRPLPFAGQEAASLIEARNYRDHWAMLADHDLVIECGDDVLGDKQSLLSRVAPGLHRDALIVSLSAGLSVEAIAQGLPAGSRSRFMGAHFFKPPRLQRGLELIPIARTEPRALHSVQGFFRDLLGAEIVVVPDRDNFAANRFLVLAAGSAFYHATRLQLTHETLTALTALVTGRFDGGLPGMLDRLGWQRFDDIHARTPVVDHAHWGEKIRLPEWIAQRASVHGNQPVLPDSQTEQPAWLSDSVVNHALSNAFQQRDWATLMRLDDAQAQFVCAWLVDLWSALDWVSTQLALPPAAVDSLIHHGLGFDEKPYALFAEFSPRKVLKTLADSDKAALKTLKIARNKENETAQQEPNPFADDATLWRDLPGSRSWRYQDELLIWQPKKTAFAFDAALLDELSTICADARQEYRILLIYHRGEQFGARSEWLRDYHDAPHALRDKLAALQRLILALRMLPRPVILSISGDIHDEGFAILMQADRIIGDMDVRCELSAFAQGLPAPGGICFEWLRRLPALSPAVHHEQIHAALAHLINRQGGIGVHRMRELGVVRGHDMFVMNRAALPQTTLNITQSWLNARLPRSYRVPQPALSADTLAMLAARGEQVRDPVLYRQLLTLFAADPATPMLSLSLTLRRESEQLLALLDAQTTRKTP